MSFELDIFVGSVRNHVGIGECIGYLDIAEVEVSLHHISQHTSLFHFDTVIFLRKEHYVPINKPSKENCKNDTVRKDAIDKSTSTTVLDYSHHE